MIAFSEFLPVVLVIAYTCVLGEKLHTNGFPHPNFQGCSTKTYADILRQVFPLPDRQLTLPLTDFCLTVCRGTKTDYASMNSGQTHCYCYVWEEVAQHIQHYDEGDCTTPIYSTAVTPTTVDVTAGTLPGVILVHLVLGKAGIAVSLTQLFKERCNGKKQCSVTVEAASGELTVLYSCGPGKVKLLHEVTNMLTFSPVCGECELEGAWFSTKTGRMKVQWKKPVLLYRYEADGNELLGGVKYQIIYNPVDRSLTKTHQQGPPILAVTFDCESVTWDDGDRWQRMSPWKSPTIGVPLDATGPLFTSTSTTTPMGNDTTRDDGNDESLDLLAPESGGEGTKSTVVVPNAQVNNNSTKTMYFVIIAGSGTFLLLVLVFSTVVVLRFLSHKSKHNAMFFATSVRNTTSSGSPTTTDLNPPQDELVIRSTECLQQGRMPRFFDEDLEILPHSRPSTDSKAMLVITPYVLVVGRFRTGNRRKVGLRGFPADVVCEESDILKLLKCRHKHLIRCYGIFRHDYSAGRFQEFCVVEYCSHGTLEDYMKARGQLDLATFRTISKQIASGLAYLHGRNIVHQGVCPSNIFIDSNYMVKLCEFKTSQRGDCFYGNTQQQAVVNSTASVSAALLYAPPEHASSLPTKESDVWSFGATLLFLLTNQLPYTDLLESGLQPFVIIFKLTKQQVTPHIPDTLPSVIQDVLESCLRHDPSERIPVCALLNHPALANHSTPRGNCTNAYQLRDGVNMVTMRDITDVQDAEGKVPDTKRAFIVTGINGIRCMVDADERLGGGSFGEVYQGHIINESGEQGNPVAVKTVVLEQKSDCVANEIAVMSKLKHPNIVQYYDAGYHKGSHVFIIMELVSAGCLADIITEHHKAAKQDALSSCSSHTTTDYTKHYIQDILQGLHYLHQHGVTHRDVKPQNVLITEDGTAKLADFGMSKIHSTTVTATNLGGTFAYMAPEALDGKITHAQDVWAVGIILLECATGVNPWTGNFSKDPMHLLYKMCEQKVPHIPDDVPPIPRDFIMHCLNVDHKLRATVPQLLQHELVTQCHNHGNPDKE